MTPIIVCSGVHPNPYALRALLDHARAHRGASGAVAVVATP